MAQTDTSKAIRDSYATDDNGRITSPGKFEGEMIYVPWFWDQGLSGCADRDNGSVYGFNITPEDRAMWPELPSRKRTINLRESDSGFVSEV
jgi:hypothetical protein